MSSRSVPCAGCGRPRTQGGSSRPDGLCRLCFHKAKRAAQPAPVVYACTAECGRRVSGPNRRCVACAGLHGAKRGPRPPQAAIVYLPKGQAGPAPSSSWWVCPREQWGQVIAAQLPRLMSVNATPVEVKRDAFIAVGEW